MNDDSTAYLPRDLEQIASNSFVAAVEFHRSIASTNDRALQLAAAGTHDLPLLVLAERQTAGRGRGNNQWWAGPGAITFSLVLDVDALTLPRGRWPQLSLAAALAIREALRPYVPQGEFLLKWPNDVYLGRRKVAGILLEGSSARPECLVIGIGINVNNSLRQAPEHVRFIATSLYDASGRDHRLAGVLLDVLSQLDTHHHLLAADELQLARRWHPHCLLRDRTVCIAAGTRHVEGRCRGIDDDGALLVENGSGLQRLLAGVVERFE